MQKMALVLSDLHYNYHCEKYVSIATQLIKKLKPDYVIQCGDALDAGTISSYLQNPKITTRFVDEINAYNAQLDVWQKAMKHGSVFHQLQGNHSERLERYLAKNCREIHEIVRTVPELLRFKERNKKGKVKFVWHPLSNWKSCKIGDVYFHHGTYFDKNVAVTNLTRYPGIKFLQGHAHRYQCAAANGVWSVSLGHGSNAEKTAHICAPNQWQQAMAVVNFINGVGHFEPILVNDGEAVFRGQTIKG